MSSTYFCLSQQEHDEEGRLNLSILVDIVLAQTKTRQSRWNLKQNSAGTEQVVDYWWCLLKSASSSSSSSTYHLSFISAQDHAMFVSLGCALGRGGRGEQLNPGYFWLLSQPCFDVALKRLRREIVLRVCAGKYLTQQHSSLRQNIHLPNFWELGARLLSPASRSAYAVTRTRRASRPVGLASMQKRGTLSYPHSRAWIKLLAPRDAKRLKIGAKFKSRNNKNFVPTTSNIIPLFREASATQQRQRWQEMRVLQMLC